MKSVLLVTSILAMICTAVVALLAIGFCLGMGANATPTQIRALKFWMLGLALLGLTGISTGIFLLRAGQLGWAAGVSIAPTVIMVMILIVALLK